MWRTQLLRYQDYHTSEQMYCATNIYLERHLPATPPYKSQVAKNNDPRRGGLTL